MTKDRKASALQKIDLLRNLYPREEPLRFVTDILNLKWFRISAAEPS